MGENSDLELRGVQWVVHRGAGSVEGPQGLRSDCHEDRTTMIQQDKGRNYDSASGEDEKQKELRKTRLGNGTAGGGKGETV